MIAPSDVIAFWLNAGPRAWFAKDDAFDAQCRAFEAAHHDAARRALDQWAEHAEGALALVLLLDQFPRNLYRGSGHAFATDGLALHFAKTAIESSFDLAVDPTLRVFFYLPFEHAEDLATQERAVFLIEGLDNAEFTKYAIVHRDIIARFSRFPHRNAALGRTTTADEQGFLDSGGFSG
ncbi:MAG: DUF924 family protein [Hyphomonadaceae bacterium]